MLLFMYKTGSIKSNRSFNRNIEPVRLKGMNVNIKNIRQQNHIAHRGKTAGKCESTERLRQHEGLSQQVRPRQQKD